MYKITSLQIDPESGDVTLEIANSEVLEKVRKLKIPKRILARLLEEFS